jgi:hypothetical protein
MSHGPGEHNVDYAVDIPGKPDRERHETQGFPGPARGGLNGTGEGHDTAPAP